MRGVADEGWVPVVRYDDVSCAAVDTSEVSDCR